MSYDTARAKVAPCRGRMSSVTSLCETHDYRERSLPGESL